MRTIVSFFLIAAVLLIALYLQTPTALAQTTATQKIAFSWGGFTTEISVINDDGTGQTRLTNNGVNDGAPTWSPDGSQIAFHSDRIQGSFNIFRMNPDGSNPVQLTSSVYPKFSQDPAWSPDATKIAFVSDPDGDGKSEIWVMNADGTNPTRLTSSELYPSNSINKVYSQARQPAWSPDGTKIAFASYRNGDFNLDIYVMNADGSNQTRLTTNPSDDMEPTWSPDGSKIAFTSKRDGNAGIYVMNADGSNQVSITNNGSQSAWSPDGSKIAFVRLVNGNLQIHSMNTDGSNQVKITNNSFDSMMPAWQTTSGPAPPPPPLPPTYSVSGRVVDSSQMRLNDPGPGISGLTISLSGAASATTQTDANGNFIIGNLPENATFTIAPTTTSWSYFPASQTFTTNPQLPNVINRNVTINFSASPIFLEFISANFSAVEDSNASITVVRSGFITGTSTIDYSTSDGTAKAGLDYVPVSGTLRFNPGESIKSFTIPIIYDALPEGNETINLTLSNPTGSISRGKTTAVLTISDPPPQLLTDGSGRAAALNAVNLVRDPFPLTTDFNFGADSRTRVVLFARYVDFLPNEDFSILTAQAIDSQHLTYPLKVEFVGKVPDFNWLSQIVVKLPDGLPSGDVSVQVFLRGLASNQVLIKIK